jgi:hypothetical protein
MHMTNFWEFNLGHLLTIFGGVISIAVVWQKLRDQVEDVSGRIRKQENELDEITRMGLLTTINQHERRIGGIEDAVRDIGAIQTDIRWIKERLNRAP